MRILYGLLMSLTCFLALTQRGWGDDLLIFTAAWCGPCQTLHNDLKQDPSLAAGYEWGFVDIDQEKELAREYNVKSVPTLVVLDKDNKEVKRQVGYKGPEQLKKWLHDTKSNGTGVLYGQKTVHYAGSAIFSRRVRSRGDD